MDPQTLKEFLEQRMRLFQPSVDLKPGSPAQTQVIVPTVDFLGADPFSMPILDFVMARVHQEYPSLDTDDYAGLRDVFGKPLVPVLSPFREQIDGVKRGQSLNNPAALSDLDADSLSANWFVTRQPGEYVTGSVRVYFEAPTFVSVSTAHRFYTNGGLNFFPSYAQSLTAEQMTTQRIGSLYYVDFIIRSEQAGDQYAVDVGEISNVQGLPSAVRVTNLSRYSGGVPRESTSGLITRTRRSLTERSLVSARAISARLTDTFSAIRNLEVVGFGDPEMARDIITGGGFGAVKAGGTAFAFGTFILLLSQFEDRGVSGAGAVQVGDRIDLNYWGMLYGLPAHQQHELFTVTNIVFSSRNAAPSFPTIYLFQLNGEVTPVSTILGGFPGLLPFVFANVMGPGKIEISDIPGGILQPTTDLGTIIIDDNDIHIGGKHDIWVRPQQDTTASLVASAMDEEPIYADRSLSIAGLGATPNIVTSTDPTVDWLALGVQRGHYIVILDGADAGSYGVLRVDRDELVLDTDLTTTDTGLAFRIVDEVVVDLVTTRHLKVPFGTVAPGNDLETFVGQDIVKLGTNLLTYQVVEGDIFRILDGPDAGDYEIVSFDTALGGSGPQLGRTMSGSNSNLTYEVFTLYGGVSRPLVRVEPTGVRLLDAAEQPTEVTVPPALPVDVRNLEGFTGAETKSTGTMGFVMPDLSPTFSPIEDVVCSRLTLFGLEETIGAELAGVGTMPATSDDVIALLREVVGAGCYGDECLPCDGYVVCISFDLDGIRLNTSLTPGVAAYWDSILTWFESTFNAFFPSHPVLAPEMGEDGVLIPWPEDITIPGSSDSDTTILQFELCLPEEFFNCCNDVFMAFPEVNIETLARLLSEMTAAGWPEQLAELGVLFDSTEPPALCDAEAGDILNIATGPNAGGYVINETYSFHLQIPIQELDDVGDTLLPSGTMTSASYLAYLNTFWGQLTICAISIRGEFAIGPCGAFWDLFQEGLPDVPDLPEPPQFDGVCYDDYGNFQDPFDWIVAFFAWLIDFLARLGFDLPEDILDQLGLDSILLALADMIFVDYAVGKATCCNVVRTYFAEPTTVEIDSGGECVVVLPEELGDTPITHYAGQPTLFAAVVGAEELLYAPCHDAPPHQVYPNKEGQTDTLEKDLPRDIEVISQSINSQLRITDLSVPSPIELGILDTRDFLELHEELFTLLSQVPGTTTPEVSDPATVTSDVISFPFTVFSAAGAVAFSQTLPFGVIAVNGQTLRVTVTDANGTHVQDHVFPLATNYPNAGALVAAINANVGFIADGGTPVLTVTNGGIFDPGGLNSLHIRTVLPGTVSSIQVDMACTAITSGVLPWNAVNSTDVGEDGSEFKVTVTDSTGTHNRSRKIPAAAYTTIAQLVAAINVAGFTDVAGSPVLQVSNNGDRLVVRTQETSTATLAVTLAVDATATLVAQGHVTYTTATGTGAYAAAVTIGAVLDKARLPALRTWRSSSTVEVLSTSGIDFVVLNVQEGDLLFIEEGLDKGGYVISTVLETSLVLDQQLLDGSPTPVKQSNDGVWDGDAADPGNKRLTVAANTFDTVDIGRYITLYGSHYLVVNGSYRVTDVDTVAGSWVELEIPAGTFPAGFTETAVHWVLTAAPSEAPADADAGGTELWGLRPFRIYSGAPSTWVVTDVSTSLDSSVATFSVQDPMDSTHYPKDGALQPFRVIRPGVQRVSSTVMADQQEGSLYYADFLVFGLGSDVLYNLPHDTRFEMVFGTYKSDGYRYETDDTRLTFSVFEQLKLHFSPSLLPIGADDDLASLVPIDGQRMELRYTWAPLVAQIQRFVTSVQERVVCSDPLVRHFLPSYTATELHYTGGSLPAVVYPKLRDLLYQLDPLDAWAVSVVEDVLRTGGATDWIHPIMLVTLTHDLDRRVIGNRSEDRLGGEEEHYFNGSNRTSYFIPGVDPSAMDADELAEPGEKLRLIRDVGAGVIR